MIVNATTYRAVKAVLASDDTVTPGQRDSALTLLNGRVPKQGVRPLLLTQKQAALLLGVSRFTIRNMTRDGQLHPVRIHECWRYRREEIEDLASGKNQPSQRPCRDDHFLGSDDKCSVTSV